MGLTTTPGRIRLLSVVAVLALALAALTSAAAVAHRRHAVSGFGSTSEPLVVTAQRIQTDLEQADASAAKAFLAGGIEPTSQLDAYRGAIAAAAADIAAAGERTGTTGPAAASVKTLAQQLPIYTGLVEQARAGNRQGFPIGAAYLRDASQLLRSQLVPAAAGVAQANAQRVNSTLAAATSTTDVAAVVLPWLLALAVLVGLQVFIARRTRRALNIGLVVASVVAIIALGVTASALGGQRRAVVAANNDGYRRAARLAHARALVYEADADQSQALIAQGNGQSFLDDFSVVAAAGVLDVAAAGAPSSVGADLTAYLSADKAIAAADAAGQHAAAVTMALAAQSASAHTAFTTVDAALSSELGGAQTTVADRVRTAAEDLNGLAVAVIAAAALAALAALIGAQARINEYR